MKSGAFSENVVFPDKFCHPDHIPTINVLEGAIVANLQDVVLIGYTQDGEEYIAASMKSPKEAAYMFARAHLNMLRQSDA